MPRPILPGCRCLRMGSTVPKAREVQAQPSGPTPHLDNATPFTTSPPAHVWRETIFRLCMRVVARMSETSLVPEQGLEP